jgi:hypothetical protein
MVLAIPDPFSVAATAVGLLKSTNDALNALRERAQRSKDLDIKDQINTLYDSVLGLKEVISRLTNENEDLRRQFEQQKRPPEVPKTTQVGDTNYYFKGDEGPFCQPCYDTKVKLVALLPSEPWNNGVRRACPVCGEYFYEKRMQFNNQIRLHRS